MPLYRVSIKRSAHLNGVVISRGLSVDISMYANTNPVIVNNGVLVRDAFVRVHGIDLQSLHILNTSWLDAQVVG